MIDSNTDLYLFRISTGEIRRLTDDPAFDSEPTYVKAVGPTIQIRSPANGLTTCNKVAVSGFGASAGIPSVRVNSMPAMVQGNQ